MMEDAIREISADNKYVVTSLLRHLKCGMSVLANDPELQQLVKDAMLEVKNSPLAIRADGESTSQ